MANYDIWDFLTIEPPTPPPPKHDEEKS